jgi:hypothetical protein
LCEHYEPKAVHKSTWSDSVRTNRNFWLYNSVPAMLHRVVQQQTHVSLHTRDRQSCPLQCWWLGCPCAFICCHVQNNGVSLAAVCVRPLPMSERTNLNMTRRLERFIRLSGLPLAGPAHQLRMDYVRATHALCILQRQCTFGRIVIAIRELLEGWADTEEEHSRVGGYQHRLLNVVDDLHSEIERWAWADLPAWP